MDIMLTALGNVLTFQNMLFMTIACFLGIIGGALPGFSATMAVALMVPFTFTMDTIPGLVTIGALYASTIFGGAFSAILLNTPGPPLSPPASTATLWPRTAEVKRLCTPLLSLPALAA